ncbi:MULTISPECIES: hypothetical protein [unclassified Serratia (in: enterobacteria)]|uniref:hypothetical protein n=1 Tax=unclassified Serratia (in: enterobacteria) TaxID=2647522 RepID=UPI003FA77834
MHLSPKSPIFPPLQPEHTGRSGHFQLFSAGNAGLGEPVAADNHLAVLPNPIRPQILPVLAGFAEFIPGSLSVTTVIQSV